MEMVVLLRFGGAVVAARQNVLDELESTASLAGTLLELLDLLMLLRCGAPLASNGR